MEYRTEAHTFMAGANYNPLPNVQLNANLSFTAGRGNMVDIYFASMYPTGDEKLDFDTSALNPNQPYLYDVAYWNDVEEYSDLEFTEVDLTIGAFYQLSKAVGVGLNYYFTDFEDDDPYVYGEQDVTVQSIMGFMTFRF